MKDRELFHALDGLCAFDSGCTDSGIKDATLRQRVIDWLARRCGAAKARSNLMDVRLHQVASLHRTWQARCIPSETPNGALAHLKEEVVELLLEPSLEEAADVLLCLLSWVDLANHDVEALLNAALVKISINNQRVWAVNENGYFKHE